MTDVPNTRHSVAYSSPSCAAPVLDGKCSLAAPPSSPRRPYGIISLFDGCGSSAVTITEAVGYAPSFITAAENDTDIRPIVAECRGYSLEPAWTSSSVAAAAFYASDVRHLVASEAV